SAVVVGGAVRSAIAADALAVLARFVHVKALGGNAATSNGFIMPSWFIRDESADENSIARGANNQIVAGAGDEQRVGIGGGPRRPRRGRFARNHALLRWTTT